MSRDEPGTDGLIRESYHAKLSDREHLRSIRKELDVSGVVCLKDFLSPAAIERLQTEILQIEPAAKVSSAQGNRKYSVKGALLEGTVIAELARTPLIMNMINAILDGMPGELEAVIDEPIRADEIVPGLNIMRGPGDVTAFHFDGTFLNILVPVFIPQLEGPNRGQLTIYPNIRSFRRNLYDRIVVPILCRLNLFRLLFTPVEVDYEIGSVYLFYGYRSYHGVLSPGAAGLRCTTNMTVGAARF
ncbi:MAG TPA: hypothetical protein VFY95_11195 [Sphingomicrobium sp.]